MRITTYYIILLFIIANTACKKFIQVDPPKTSLIRETVFQSDPTAQAAVLGVYYNFLNTLGYRWDVPTGLAGDELEYYSIGDRLPFFENNLTALTTGLTSLWDYNFNSIYMCNDVLEGLSTSAKVTPAYKKRLSAEVRFLRAFSYFYLVNAFGRVPLDTTTSYQENAIRKRANVEDIYKLMISDLTIAAANLDEQYLNASQQPTTERKRLNRYAAKAMLARVYLYHGDYALAEAAASEVIAHTELYKDAPIAGMFLKNSTESIWQLGKEMGNTFYPAQYRFAANKPESGALRTTVYNLFAPEDLRRVHWIRSYEVNGTAYYLPGKYKEETSATNVEYMSVLRLGEVYLIRAEARSKQTGKLTGDNSALNDLNYIRHRAGLQDTLISTPTAMAVALEEERVRELFTEWGHRWFDLKRTGRANAVLGPLKGINWQETDQLFPIPMKEIQNNPGLADDQNPGYN